MFTFGAVYMLFKVVLSFESVNEILKCDHSNKDDRAVLFCSAVYHAVQGSFNFLSLWMKFKNATIQMKTTEQYFPVLFIVLYMCRVVLT